MAEPRTTEELDEIPVWSADDCWHTMLCELSDTEVQCEDCLRIWRKEPTNA